MKKLAQCLMTGAALLFTQFAFAQVAVDTSKGYISTLSQSAVSGRTNATTFTSHPFTPTDLTVVDARSPSFIQGSTAINVNVYDLASGVLVAQGSPDAQVSYHLTNPIYSSPLSVVISDRNTGILISRTNVCSRGLIVVSEATAFRFNTFVDDEYCVQ